MSGKGGKDNKPSAISYNEEKKDVARGAERGQTQLDTFGRQQNAFAQPQSRQKGAASQNRLDSDTPYNIFLALDPSTKPSGPVIQVMDEAESKSDTMSVDDAMPWVNDVTSHEVKGQTPEQVLQGLTSVLLQYSQEMDLSVNEAEQCIDCVLFTESSFEGLRFKLGVFKHGGATRFELLRHDGAALSMAKLEGDLKTLFFAQNKGTDNKEAKEDDASDPFSFIAMDLDVSGLPALPSMDVDAPSGISQRELDALAVSLDLDDLYDLHCDLADNAAMAQDVTDHGTFVATLMDTVAKHKDVAVGRACLLLLERLCMDKETAMLLMTQNAIYKRLGEMLSGESLLIRNYALRLLATLSTMKWNMDSDLAKQVGSAVKEYHAEWKKAAVMAQLVEEKTFTTIYDKLAQFN